MTVRDTALSVALLAACGTPSPAPFTSPSVPTGASSSPPTSPSPAMTTPALSSGASAPLLAASGDSIQYAVGNPNFRGRTTVKIAGDGAVEVSSEAGGKIDRYTGTLDAAELGKLRETLAANDPRALDTTPRNGVPDEARIELTLGGARNARIELWDNEQWKQPALRALVVAFNEIASKVSDGKIRY